MSPDQIWKLLGLLLPLVGSLTQVFTTLRKRSNWIMSAKGSVNGLGVPFLVLDRFPLLLGYAGLGLVLLGSFLGLVGGYMMVQSPSEEPPLILKQSFQHSLLLAIMWAIVAVVIQFNALGWILLQSSHLIRPFYKWVTYHPGWINAFWHIKLEEAAVPVNTNRQVCGAVANQIIKAWAEGKKYDQHEAKKPLGFTNDELANFLLIANGIESALHDLDVGKKVQFGPLYEQLGKVGFTFYSPGQLIACAAPNKSLYALLRASVPGLPDEPAVDTALTQLVRQLAKRYSGRSFRLAQGCLPIGYDAGLLERRLRRLPGFRGKRAMRIEVVKLGVEMKVWYDMDPGPFAYPPVPEIAQFLLNLGCLRTREDAKVITCSDEFERLTAWSMDRLVDAVEVILKATTDPRLVGFCQTVFNTSPQAVPRWALCCEVDYFLWVQTRDTNTTGGIFGAQATQPWKIAGNGNSLTKS